MKKLALLYFVLLVKTIVEFTELWKKKQKQKNVVHVKGRVFFDSVVSVVFLTSYTLLLQ